MSSLLSPPSLLAALAVILIHGAGHVVFARLVGVRFCRVGYTPTGFRLITDGRGFPSYFCELIATLGGPLANVISAALVHAHTTRLPHAFVSLFVPLSLYLAALNLLPLRGFDGGGLLICLLCGRHPPLPSLLPDTAERILSICSGLVLFLLWLLSIYLLLCRDSALSLYVFCTQLFRTTLIEHHDAQAFSSISKNR